MTFAPHGTNTPDRTPYLTVRHPQTALRICTWLSFLPLHKTFYPAALLLMPRRQPTQTRSCPSPQPYPPPILRNDHIRIFRLSERYEQVQIARFQNPRNHITRPIWQNMPYPTVLKSFDSMDWFLNP